MRSFDDIEFGDAVELKKAELELADQLIDQLSSERFEPEKYEDDYRARCSRRSSGRSRARRSSRAPAPAAREQIIDLVAALKKSLGERREARGGEAHPASASPPRPRAAEPARARRAGSSLRRAWRGALSTLEVSRILGLREARVRELVRAGLVQPARRGRGYAFSFQDLVVLRAAKELLERHVPAARVRRALAALAAELPEGRPLSGLRIFADGREVAVRDGWRDLAAGDRPDRARLRGRRPRRRVEETRPRARRGGDGAFPAHDAARARAAFERALALEDDDPEAARDAYRRALALDPGSSTPA